MGGSTWGPAAPDSQATCPHLSPQGGGTGDDGETLDFRCSHTHMLVLGLLFTRGVVLEGTRNSYSVSLSFLICEMG